MDPLANLQFTTSGALIELVDSPSASSSSSLTLCVRSLR